MKQSLRRDQIKRNQKVFISNYTSYHYTLQSIKCDAKLNNDEIRSTMWPLPIHRFLDIDYPYRSIFQQ